MSPANKIKYKGTYYATLGDVPIVGSSTTCQRFDNDGYRYIPNGWEVAMESNATRTLIRSYGWSTSFVYLKSNGNNDLKGIGTLNALNQYTSYGAYCIDSYAACYVWKCNGQILLRKIPYGLSLFYEKSLML